MSDTATHVERTGFYAGQTGGSGCSEGDRRCARAVGSSQLMRAAFSWNSNPPPLATSGWYVFASAL